MKTLMIAGLAMVTAGAASPAQAQRLVPAPMGGGQVVVSGGQSTGGGQVMAGGQAMGGGQSMPRPPMNAGMPQRYPGANYPSPQQRPPMAPPQSRGGGHWSGGGQWSGGAGGGHWSGNSGGGQWSSNGGGHWSGGMNAPGGWNAYRRPTRGWTLPRYWIAPTFYISDYASYGLGAPPAGYGWSRYYDDAVLIDGRGRVADAVNGVDWDGYGYAQDGGYAQGSDGGYASADYGYAQGSEAGYGAGYASPPAPRHIEYRGNPQGGYTSSTYSSGAGYVSGGYYFPPATTTVVTVQSAPVVTTTTTEYIETYVARRRVARPVRRWHPPVKRSCTCSCGCR